MRYKELTSYFFMALFLSTFYVLFLVFSPFLNHIFWAFILVFALYPLYLRILPRVRQKRTIAALIITFSIILVILPPSVVLFISFLKELIQLYQKIRDIFFGNKWDIFTQNMQHLSETQWVQRIWPFIELFQERLSDLVLNGTQKAGEFATTQLAVLPKNLIKLMGDLFVLTLLIFFFFCDGESIYQFFYELIPLGPKNKEMLAQQLNETFSAVIRGQLLTCLIHGISMGLVFWLLKLPMPLLVGFFAFFTILIPVVGVPLVWGPFACYLFLTGQFWPRLTLLLIAVSLISLIEHIVKPIVIGKKANLPVLLLFFGMLGGLELFGVTGIFLVPAVLSLFFILAKIYHEEYTNAA